MRLIKTFLIAYAIFVLSILAGCSDEKSSPLISPPIADERLNEKDAVQLTKETNSEKYHVHLRLKPNQIYSFDFSNTGLYTFNSISVSNYYELKRGLEIIGYMDDQLISLEYSSSGFYARSISIKNLTSGFMYLDVILGGSKKKIIYPDPRIIATQD